LNAVAAVHASASLRVEGLRVEHLGRAVVADASLSLQAGEVVALVGSSGSGKTMTARALLGLVPLRPGVVAGQISLDVDGVTLKPKDEADFRPIRGGVVGMLWQDARGALDPLRTVGAQLRSASALAGETCDVEGCLARVGFSDPARVAGLYPHTLSGGMAQRAAIAVALARKSRFLLADEPTTGLDPAVQREVLAQLRAVAAQGAGILFITHDLRLLPGFADRVIVMDDGRTVEEASTVGALRGVGRALVEATRKIAGGVL
jgi:ABC-type glutathione transport system ATPase component